MNSLGGGIVLLCLAMIGIIMSSKLWLRLICFCYLAIYFIGTLFTVITGKYGAEALLMPVLITVFGYYVYYIQHMNDPNSLSFIAGRCMENI